MWIYRLSWFCPWLVGSANSSKILLEFSRSCSIIWCVFLKNSRSRTYADLGLDIRVNWLFHARGEVIRGVRIVSLRAAWKRPGDKNPNTRRERIDYILYQINLKAEDWRFSRRLALTKPEFWTSSEFLGCHIQVSLYPLHWEVTSSGSLTSNVFDWSINHLWRKWWKDLDHFTRLLVSYNFCMLCR